MFPKLITAEPPPNYHLELVFDDSTTGMADVSHLAERGVFRQWDAGDLFFQVKIDPETNALVRNETLDLDPNKLYLQIQRLTFA